MTIRHHQPLQVIPGESDPGLTELPDAGFPDALVVYNMDYDYDALDWVKHSASAVSAGGALTDAELRASAVLVSVAGLSFNGVYAKVVAVQEEGAVFNDALVGATDSTPIGNVLDALKVTGPDLSISLESDASHNPLYMGLAAKGSLTSAGAWQIRKFTIDANNNVSAIRYANASAAFTAVWDDRAILSYS